MVLVKKISSRSCLSSGDSMKYVILFRISATSPYKTIYCYDMQSAYNACVALVNAGCDISTNAPFDFGKKSKQP